MTTTHKSPPLDPGARHNLPQNVDDGNVEIAADADVLVSVPYSRPLLDQLVNLHGHQVLQRLLPKPEISGGDNARAKNIKSTEYQSDSKTYFQD